jgi:hypothetical protein
MLNRVYANTFNRFMTSGRTFPALFRCNAANSFESEEYVVKLRHGVSGKTALLCEAYAALLAKHFDMTAPEPALIEIDAELANLAAETMDDARRTAVLRESVGLNFGTKFLPNISTWPVDRGVPAGLLDDAIKVFAFDALLQNPDRRYNNPNLGTIDGRIVIFDHELCFSFLLDIFPSEEPWKLASQQYLADHVFIRQLKDQAVPESFRDKISELTDDALESFSDLIPEGWRQNAILRIENHLRLIREHADEFTGEIERRLA